jgi:hypothetical protein
MRRGSRFDGVVDSYVEQSNFITAIHSQEEVDYWYVRSVYSICLWEFETWGFHEGEDLDLGKFVFYAL